MTSLIMLLIVMTQLMSSANKKRNNNNKKKRFFASKALIHLLALGSHNVVSNCDYSNVKVVIEEIL